MKVPPADWPEVSALLDEALDLPCERRRAWVDALSETASRHRETLRRLLADHDQVESGDFMQTLPRLDLADDGAGTQVGPYRLQREIGRGGMGSVWLAERSDGLLRRPVALKLPHPAFATRAFAERLARERDILAALAHPHIARLYDAGLGPEGQPYIALEYVPGQSITAHCEDGALDVGERIGLFLQVLSAVQYAHAHLVIHRDIKPSNVLVDDQGQVRLLDFGIAKLMTEGEAESTQLTLEAGQPLSIDYASPEQIAGAPVSTASDVYSLGVLLFELLAGQRPYRLGHPSREGLVAALQAQPAPRPSSVAPPARARALRGDLDTIVAKALRAAPEDRYATAQAMADDLQRHLDGEPVLAQPDSAGYRLRKFVGRHRAGVAAGAAVSLLLMGALGVSLYEAHEAREQAARVLRESAKTKAVQEFLLDIFRANSDDQPNPARARATSARELLDIGARRVQQSLNNAPESQLEVLSTLSDMYYDLGLNEESARMAEQAIEVQRRVSGADSREVAEQLVKYAGSLHGTPLRERILPALDEARRILDRLHDDGSHLRAELLIRYAQRYQNLSVVRMRDYADAALRVIHDHPEAHPNIATALHLAARSRTILGDFAGALPLYRQALAHIESDPTSGEAQWQIAQQYLGETLWRLQQFDEAESTMRASLERSRQRSGEHHPNTLFSQGGLGLFLVTTGRVDEGRRLLDGAVQGALDTLGEGNTLVTPGMRSLSARGWLEQGRADLALALLERVVASNSQHYPDSVVLAGNLRDQAKAWSALGRHADAEAQLRRALAMNRAAVGDGAVPWHDDDYHLLLAQLRLAQGDPRGAAAELALLAPADAGPPLPMPRSAVEAHRVRAQIAQAEGRPADALHEAQAALAQVRGSSARPAFARLEAETAQQVARLGAVPPR